MLIAGEVDYGNVEMAKPRVMPVMPIPGIGLVEVPTLGTDPNSNFDPDPNWTLRLRTLVVVHSNT